MPPTEDCLVFSFRGAATNAGEVVRAALFRGDIGERLSEVALAAASEAQAEEEELEADEAAIDEGVEGFRVENDLISAEETEAWLEQRGISAEELQSHFTRRYWLDALTGKVEAPVAEAAGLTPDLIGQLDVDLFVSGTFPMLSTALSRRLVARADSGGAIQPGQVLSETAHFTKRTGIEPGDVDQWLGSLGRSRAWFDGMLEMEAAYRGKCDAVLTPERLAKALSALRLPLTRLELEVVEFDSIDAAREGLLCVRDDNLSLEEVARESRYPFKRTELWADSLPDDARQKLLCAAIGEVQPPVLQDGVYQLGRVVNKTEPTLDDPTVRTRVEQRILDSHFSDMGAMEITWFIR